MSVLGGSVLGTFPYLFEKGIPFPEYYPIVQKLSDVGALLRCLYVFMVNTSFKLRI